MMFAIAGLEISFHRIGLAGWQPGDVLRSWAEAPWRATPHGVAVACRPEEALWLGIGNDGTSAELDLRRPVDGATRRLYLPNDWQLGWLLDPNGNALPIQLGDQPSVAHRMDIRAGVHPDAANRQSITREMLLLSPTAWAAAFGPLELAPVSEPAPVPLYSRQVHLRSRIGDDPASPTDPLKTGRSR